jgi:hypothetical protein
MMRRSLRRVLILAASLPALVGSGCRNDDSPNAPAGDLLVLQAIAPASGNLVLRGQTTLFESTLRYQFATALRGQLTVVVHSSWAAFPGIIRAETLRQLDSPSGQVSVSVDVAVPSTAGGGTLDLTFGIIPEGASENSASVSAHYGVSS